MRIENFIPQGKDNAISRTALCIRTGRCERENRRLIQEARDRGAIGLFGDKYGEVVKVYTIGDVSMEMCGVPHASNTGDLGKFVITKEQSSSSGVRRIKAELRKD